jgi:hypothetical protein
MIEIKNRGRGPVQLMVRSRRAPAAFTTLIIPGIGKGNNVRLIEDEIALPLYIERAERNGFISTRYVPNSGAGSSQGLSVTALPNNENRKEV